MSILRHLSVSLILASLAIVPACDKAADSSKSDGDSKDAKKDAPAAPSKDPAKELFTSKAPELPGPLAKLTFGMTEEEVNKAAPELEKGYASSKEFKDTKFGYYVPKDKKKLTSMRVVVEAEGADLEKILVAAWGEPKRGTDLKSPKLFWFNPDKAIRATVHQGYGKEKEVQFEAYLPAKKLLGEGKEKLGFETTPILGSTYEDITKNYAEWVEVLTKEQAEKQRANIEKMMGKKLDVLGEATASTNIDLLPTEFGSSFTRVNPTLENGKVIRFRVGIDYEPFPAAKDEIFKMFEEKWGKPTEQEDLGRKQFLFNPAAPKVVVQEDNITGKWDIEVEP